MLDRPNMLEFCLSPDLGGLELFMVECYQGFLTRTNCYVMVSPNKRLDQHIDSNNKFYLKRNKFFPFLPALKLAKFIDKYEIDLIHFHWTKDMAVVVLAKVLSRRKPKVVQTRNMTMTRFKDDIYHKWLYKNIEMMHAVTYQVRDQLKKFIPQDVRPEVDVVYMGTNEEKVNESKIKELQEKYELDNNFIVGIVGRIEEGKGQYLVLEALAKLKSLDIKVIVVGHTMDEVYLESLKEQVQVLGIAEQVIFTGFTKEVSTHMSLCDTIVLGTKRETFGLVVIEAMINKVTVIATNKGGPLEIIDNGIDGLLFDRTSNDLATKIKLLYNNSSLKEQLALEGYKKARNIFSLEEQLNKLYESINKEVL